MAPSILGLASAILGIPTITTFIQNLISALTRNSEYIENVQCTRNQLQEFEDEDLLGKMSILLTPTGYSNGSLNTVIPPYQVLSELVTNGSFDTDSDWSNSGSWSITNGVATYDGLLNIKRIYQTVNFVQNKIYKISFDITNTVDDYIDLFFGQDATTLIGRTDYAVGSYEFYVTATSTSQNLSIYAYNTSYGGGSIDNVSVKEIQEADFDFSRGSSATRVNEQGLVEDVQILSGELVQNGNFEEIGSELVTNGNFDTDSDWNLSRAVIENGVGKLQESVGTFARIRQDINFTGQTKVTYTISFNNSSKTTIQLRSYGGGNNEPIPATVGTHTIYKNFTSDAVSFQTGDLASDEEIHLDNVSVKEVGQNWTFGTGWSINDGKVYFDNPTGTEFRQSLATTAGKYRISFDLDITSGTIQTSFSSPSVSTIEAFTTSGTKTVDITTTASFSRFRFVGLANSVFNIDNVSVKEVTDDTDLPRIDYSPYSGAGTCGHLLLEPQRTNLITYSEDFSTWTTQGNISISSNNNTSPSGNLDATLLSITDTSTTTKIQQPTPVTSGDTYTFSVYLKSDSNLTLEIGGISGAHTAVNTTNEWQRFSVTQVASSNNRFPQVKSSGTQGTFYMWGAQLEDGDYATSYIPTNGTTVTRSQDVANNSGNADLFNDSEGVLYAEISSFKNGGIGDRAISISDRSTQNAIQLYLHNTANRINFRLRSGGNLDVNISDFTFEQNQINKIACKYKSGDYALWINGEVRVTSTSSSLPSGLSVLAFDDGSLNDFYGNVKCVAVFKEALSNNELELLTGEGYNSFAALAAASNYNVI